jgi:hypothetical protein
MRIPNKEAIGHGVRANATYAEPLHKLFGPRLIGLHITRQGDGMEASPRRVNGGAILIYTVGRGRTGRWRRHKARGGP